MPCKVWKGNLFRLTVRAVSLVLMILASCYLGNILWQYKAAKQEYEELASQVFVQNKTDTLSNAGQKENDALPKEDSRGLKEEKENVIHNSIQRLMQSNEEMIGWIAFEHPDINYPVMQGEDNEYYLNHTFQGEKNPSGSIFADAINSSDWNDAHTIVYGHNMKNLSMFGSLRSYKRKDFYGGNEYFSIYTDRMTYVYQIFSCYEVPEDSDVYTVWYTADENFEKLVDRMKQQSYYDTGVEVSGEDKIITLSTCSTEGNRFVIHAKRVE